MSLILDALNKADRERQNTATPPGINTVQDTQAFQTGRPWWFYALIVVTVFLVAGAVFGLYQALKPSTPTPATAPSVVESATPKKSTKIPGLPKPVLVKKESETPTITQSNSTQTESTQPKAIQPKKVERPGQQQAVNELYTNTQSNSEAETRETKVSTATTDAGREMPTDTQTVLAEPPKKPTTLNDYPLIGSVGELPWTILNSLPSLNYSSHQYTGDQGRSYITINEQRKSEGQNLNENVRIDHILKDGVILSYQNHQFKLKALSSWVNI